MTEAKPEGEGRAGLSPEGAAKMLGVSEARVAVLAGQGRLRDAGTPEDPRYDLDSVLAMQAEDLVRGMLEEAGDKNPKLRDKIDTLAMLQYQRGREASQRSEHPEFLDRAEKVRAEQQADLEELRGFQEELRRSDERAEERLAEMGGMNADAERRLEELRALVEGRLRPIPSREDARRTG